MVTEETVNGSRNTARTYWYYWRLGVLLISAAAFFQTGLVWSTAEFRYLNVFNIFWWGITVFFIAIATALSLPLYLIRKVVKNDVILFLSPWVVLSLIIVGMGLYNGGSPSRRFRSLVIDPLPSSVTQIKDVGLSGIEAGRWLFGFKADHSDVEQIARRLTLTRTNAPHENELRAIKYFPNIEWTQGMGKTNNLFFIRESWSEEAYRTHLEFLAYDPSTSNAWFATSR